MGEYWWCDEAIAATSMRRKYEPRQLGRIGSAVRCQAGAVVPEIDSSVVQDCSILSASRIKADESVGTQVQLLWGHQPVTRSKPDLISL